jgi:hypothetical protein
MLGGCLMIDTPCVLDDMPSADYHADPVAEGSLSQSGAKTLLKSPAKFYWDRTHPQPPRDVFDVGHAAHAVALGADLDTIYVAPYDDWTRRKGPAGGVQYTTDEKSIARDDGLTPILPEQWVQVCDMAEALHSHPDVKAMELLHPDGDPEVSMFAPDAATEVWRRARVDYLLPDLIVDLKTTRDAHPKAFERDCGTFSYFLQSAYYIDLARDLELPVRGFVFIAIEKEPPYRLSVGELHPEDVALGRSRAARALQMYRDCVEAGVWPTWDVSAPERPIHTLRIPPWHHNESEAG